MAGNSLFMRLKNILKCQETLCVAEIEFGIKIMTTEIDAVETNLMVSKNF